VTINQSLTDDDFDALLPQDVTVYIKDNDPPVITGCPADITVSNDPGLCSAVVTWTLPTSTAPMVSTHNPGDTFPVGTTTVTYTSTDSDGMVSVCSFTVNVNDIENPVVACVNTTISLDASGNASIVPADILSSVPTDNCAVTSVTLSRSSFTCADLGPVTVTVTVTDVNGNVATCDALLTIEDPFPASLNAGPDGMICITSPDYNITGAIAANVMLLWTTSGSGSFSDPTVINPVYTRGPTDLTNVTLTLTGNKINGCPVTLTDDMMLSFAGVPVASAGADMDLCSGTPDVALSDASASNGSVTWATSGDGTFSDPSSPNPVYTFGPSDTGPVILTMTVNSLLCGTATDDIIITFTSAPVADAGSDGSVCRTEPGFQISGASHAGGTVNWTTSGNGTFDDMTAENPYYTFGTFDYSLGTVTLTMEVTGGGPCGADLASIVVTINPLPVIQVTQLNDISCTGLTDGEIHLDATTGLAPYSYSIDGSPFQSSGDFTGLSSASYYFEVMDANGCISDTTLEINEPLPFTAEIDSTWNVSCSGGNDGAIYVTASGGTEPYNISWTGPSGFTASTADITSLVAGTYNLTITDLNSCAVFDLNADLTEPLAITIISAVLSDYDGFGVSCNGSSDGSISVTVSGGTAPLAFLWSGPGGYTSTQDEIENVPAGTYTLTITDINGCELIQDYPLASPDPIALTASGEDASCPDTPDGSIDLSVTGGSGTLSYQWDDGATTQDRTGLLPGDYTVTVTDDNGCSAQLTVTVDMTGVDCLKVYEIITPNGDGRNDTWKLKNAELYPNGELFVYNRWGRLVFHTRDLTEEWNGTYNGKLLPNDSYHYVIHLNDGSEPRTGVITIISK
jgi:gliding motility-associated-like protein